MVTNLLAPSPEVSRMSNLVERPEEGQWLLIKRDLYERPDHLGYTGIRDNAGRYSKSEADDHAAYYGADHVVRLEDAPEFRASAFPDLVQAHLIKQRDERDAVITRLKAEVEGLKKENELLQGEVACHDEEERGWEEDAAKDRARIKELEAEREAVASAMWQLLDDMGADGLSVSLLAKVQARIAFEPYADGEAHLDFTVKAAQTLMAAHDEDLHPFFARSREGGANG